MVLVDTSVWIRFLANRMPYAAELDRLLREKTKSPGTTSYTGELQMGGSSSPTQLLNSYDLIHRVPPVGHADVATFVRSHKFHGKGIG